MDRKTVPAIYILHGEDEFAIDHFVDQMIARLGDPSTAMMNITRLDGRYCNIEELRSGVSAMPFLTSRRMIILTNPLVSLKRPDARKKFLNLLEHTPSSTALLLIEYKILMGKKGKKGQKPHWLEKWARENHEQAFIRAFPLPKGNAMIQWVQARAESMGGKFTPRGAGVLASLIGDNTRLADLEIQKLLAYVNYQRPVEADDVEILTAVIPQGDIFAMVDALGNQDGKRAMWMLHRLLDIQEPISVFGMVVRQFRLLLLAREVLDRGGNEKNVTQELSIHPYVAGKITTQARHFTIPSLEKAYHRLLEMDQAVKTGRIPGDLALDTLVASFTSRKVI